MKTMGTTPRIKRLFPHRASTSIRVMESFPASLASIDVSASSFSSSDTPRRPLETSLRNDADDAFVFNPGGGDGPSMYFLASGDSTPKDVRGGDWEPSSLSGDRDDAQLLFWLRDERNEGEKPDATAEGSGVGFSRFIRGEGLKWLHFGQTYSAVECFRSISEQPLRRLQYWNHLLMSSYSLSRTSPLCAKQFSHMRAYRECCAPPEASSSPRMASASLSYHCFRGGAIGWGTVSGD